MLNTMKLPVSPGIRSPEHDATHGLRTVRLFSYRRLLSRLQATADYRDAVGGLRIEDGT
jgi:hypothetical protein